MVIEPNQHGRPVVRVIDQPALDALLKSKRTAMKAALGAGDTATAASYMTSNAQAKFKKVLTTSRFRITRLTHTWETVLDSNSVTPMLIINYTENYS